MKELLKALSEAKKEITPITKDSTNPFFKSKYFDINQILESVEPILLKNGLVIMQPVSDGKVSTILFHVDSGESIDSSIDLPNIADPQKLGMAITYYRRYTIQSLLALQAEDDDGNTASKETKKDNSKPWLNRTSKDGVLLAAYTQTIDGARKKGSKLKDLEAYFQMSEETKEFVKTDLGG